MHIVKQNLRPSGILRGRKTEKTRILMSEAGKPEEKQMNFGFTDQNMYTGLKRKKTSEEIPRALGSRKMKHATRIM